MADGTVLWISEGYETYDGATIAIETEDHCVYLYSALDALYDLNVGDKVKKGDPVGQSFLDIEQGKHYLYFYCYAPYIPSSIFGINTSQYTIGTDMVYQYTHRQQGSQQASKPDLVANTVKVLDGLIHPTSTE